MNSTDAAARFALEHATYARLSHWVADRLERGATRAGVYQPTMSGRAKAIDSFIKKAIRKGYTDPWNEITDKSGVRITVSLLEEVQRIDEVVSSTFDVHERVDKAEALGDDRFSYLGLHFLVTPKEKDLDDSTRELAGLTCEIQVHTRAQNAWATVSHPLIYKPPGSTNVSRRINRLIALVELFDSEVASARELVMAESQNPEARMLQVLESEYFRLAGRDFDQALSLQLLELLADAYAPDELERFSDLIEAFLVGGGRDFLQAVFDREQHNESASPLLYQPETIVILERLNNAKAKLRQVWNTQIDGRLLERLSETLGRPYS